MTASSASESPTPVRRPDEAGLHVVEELPVVTADGLRRAFRRHAAGVAVVTANGPAGPVGLTVTSLASASADPPTLSFNVACTSSSWPVLSVVRYVGVHLLADGQTGLAERFARSGIDRFSAPTVWSPGPYRVPVLDGCVGWMVAAVGQRFVVADHAIVVARVLHLDVDDAAQPLVHQDGAFRRLVAAKGGPARSRRDNSC
jgi:flavin reductase (DIM6/NTAB) family NADH-FMN oxidoreductase RutF